MLPAGCGASCGRTLAGLRANTCPHLRESCSPRIRTPQSRAGCVFLEGTPFWMVLQGNHQKPTPFAGSNLETQGSHTQLVFCLFAQRLRLPQATTRTARHWGGNTFLDSPWHGEGIFIPKCCDSKWCTYPKMVPLVLNHGHIMQATNLTRPEPAASCEG